MPCHGRLDVLGTEHSGCCDTIFLGLLPVHGRPLPVFVYVSLAGIGEQFVQLRRPVMGAGRVEAHDRCALHRLEGSHARHPG